MELPQPLMEALSAYSDLKRGLEQWAGAGEDLLHVHSGLLIFLVAALVFRGGMRSPWPILLVVVLAILNEVVDVIVGGATGAYFSLVDVANTVFWPGVAFAVARLNRR